MSQITMSVEGLPCLGKGEAYSCFFQDTQTRATLTTLGVICPTPDANSLPPIDHGDGMYNLHWYIVFNPNTKDTLVRSQTKIISTK